jgi:hypothetical protein
MGFPKIKDLSKYLLMTDDQAPQGTPFYSQIFYFGRVLEDDETLFNF